MSVHPDCEKKWNERVMAMNADRYRQKFILRGICPDCSGDLIDKTGLLGIITGCEKHICSSCGEAYTYMRGKEYPCYHD